MRKTFKTNLRDGGTTMVRLIPRRRNFTIHGELKHPKTKKLFALYGEAVCKYLGIMPMKHYEYFKVKEGVA